ncbi:hypothetical protein ABZ770_44065, partial [Streptomyces sp. NPDC006654]|uniref:hypothetical protein n=1 Tax=Streptomyces sp. NPDC006654 TaxID=3156897 RepID=UPI00340A77A5
STTAATASTQPAVAAVVLPDGRALAVTASDDETVRVWDLTTGLPVGDVLLLDAPATGLATAFPVDGSPVAVIATRQGLAVAGLPTR